MAKNAKQFEQRPWGTFEVIHEFNQGDGSEVVVKKIVVHPGKRLSYQSHKKRKEHWLIVEGSGHVILDGEEIKVDPESKVVVDLGKKHRIINSHPKDNLTFIEVSLGEFDENDIVRYEDDFGRA
jgi:mannose-6-phosphate isomerase-like protein (cupin superfamily)